MCLNGDGSLLIQYLHSPLWNRKCTFVLKLIYIHSCFLRENQLSAGLCFVALVRVSRLRKFAKQKVLNIKGHFKVQTPPRNISPLQNKEGIGSLLRLETASWTYLKMKVKVTAEV